jgi:hypothetical protein
MHFFISLLIVFSFAFVICTGLVKMVWDLSQIGVHESPAILETFGNPADSDESNGREHPFLLGAGPVRAPPCRGGLSRRLPELLAQVRLVGEAAPQGDVAQGRIGGKHIMSRQLHAPSHDE